MGTPSKIVLLLICIAAEWDGRKLLQRLSTKGRRDYHWHWTLSTSNGTTIASFTASDLSVGQHTISASYSGDGNFLADVGATFTQYVNTNVSGYPKLSSGTYNLSNANLPGGLLPQRLARWRQPEWLQPDRRGFPGSGSHGRQPEQQQLQGVERHGADLTGADLRNSNFKEANLAGVNLTGANLTGVNPKGTTGLKTATLTNIVWNNTTCPDGTISSNNNSQVRWWLSKDGELRHDALQTPSGIAAPLGTPAPVLACWRK